jgi:hypothetical protein
MSGHGALPLLAAVVASGCFLFADLGQAAAAQPPVEVAPGVYLASYSQHGPPPGATRGQAPARRSGEPPRAEATPAVSGGSKVGIRRWPWLAEIKYLYPFPEDPVKSHHCGGSLLAPRVIVTAAHCMTLGSGSFERDPAEFRVVTGRTKLTGKGGREHGIADYFWFVDESGAPLWDPDTVVWDVAIILLDSPSGRETIRIAGKDEAAVWGPGQRALVAGWGLTGTGTDHDPLGSTSDNLRQARIRMISDSGCDRTYGPLFVSATMVCAGIRAGGLDACGGDSGGPLVVPVNGRRHRLIGAVSWAAGCGLPRVPGVYSRLAADPIREAVAEGVRVISGDEVLGSGAMQPNRFRIGSRIRPYRRGGARLVVRVPGAGQLRLQGTGRLRPSVAYPRQAGRAVVRLRLRDPLRRRLDRRGWAAVRVWTPLTYTPLHGEPRERSARIRLVRRSG